MGHQKSRRVTTCAFCHLPANSREHAWPDWLLKKLAVNPQFLHGHIEGKDPGFNPTQKAIRLKCVCTDCNTKWMKTTFEDTARPIMLPLIDDIPTKLDILQQATVAAWVAKTAMIFEYVTLERNLYYSDAERKHFRASVIPVPPPCSAVWIGRFAHGSDPAFNFVTAGVDAGGSNLALPGVQAYITTMAFGYLAIQVVTVRSNQREPRETVFHPKKRTWGDALVRIWPAHKIVRWPPDRSFSNDSEPTLDDLHEQFENPTIESGGYFADEVISVTSTFKG